MRTQCRVQTPTAPAELLAVRWAPTRFHTGALRSGVVSKGAALLLLLLIICMAAHVVHVHSWTHARHAQSQQDAPRALVSAVSAVADSGSYDGAHQGGRANYYVAAAESSTSTMGSSSKTPAAHAHTTQPHAHHRTPQVLTGAWPSHIDPAHLDAVLRLPEAASRRASPLQPLPLHSVRLAAGSQEAAAQERNRRYLLEILQPDRLLHSFRVTAGLQVRTKPVHRIDRAHIS